MFYIKFLSIRLCVMSRCSKNLSLFGNKTNNFYPEICPACKNFLVENS